MRHSAPRSGRHKPVDPPVRLVLAMTILGMLIGALLAPAAEDGDALRAWLKDLAAIQAPANKP